MDQAFQTIPLKQLKEHPANPRQHFDEHRLDELASSIKDKGILNPLLVRPQGSAFEILAGARRFRAAKKAGLLEAPAIVRTLDDEAAFELMLVDNLQREDVHPLEEGAGYNALMLKAGYTVERIAERVGRSVKYVYDRVKLLQLTKEAQQLFLDGKITAGHAILIARLSPADQKRVLGSHDGGFSYGDNAVGGLFTAERLLWHPDEEDREDEDLKPVSVRELQAWIDKHVKLEATEADPMLFPELVNTVQAAVAENEKVVRITHNTIPPDELRDGPKVVLGNSWKRADGKRKSKTCDRSVIGMVVIGPGRGEAFRVCVDKQRCAVHWPDHVKAAKKRAAAAAAPASSSPAKGNSVDRQAAREAAQRKKEQEEAARAKAERQRWEKASPAITKALVAGLKKASARADGALGRFVLKAFDDEFYGSRAAAKHMSPGKTADDLVRFLGFSLLVPQLEDRYDMEALVSEIKKVAGVDVQKIRDEVAPVEKAAGAVARCKKCGCTEDKACPGGCSWAEQPNKKTGLGLCTACRAKQKAKNPKVKGAPRAQASA